MIKDLWANKIDYLLLLFGLLIGFVFFFGYLGMPRVERYAVIGFCTYYFLWGIVHHWHLEELHIKIVLEYLLISIFGAVTLLSLISSL
jgi:hypothetical protein